MSDQARPVFAEPLSRDAAFEEMTEATSKGALVGPTSSPIIQVEGRIITAQHVAVKRTLKEVMAQLKIMCATFGDTYVYSWEVNDRRNQRKVLVEGGTIKLANDLLMLWGNSSADCDVHETPTHYVFKAWFTDYERGSGLGRGFRQRKSQNTGLKDVERAEDIVFQIGQSKAIRNVVLNALGSLAQYAIEESKKALVNRLEDEENLKAAVGFIDRVMTEHQIAVKRVEAVRGRERGKWTIRDIAKTYMEMRGVYEGFLVADEVYPTDEAAGEVMAKKQAKDEPAGDKKDPGANSKAAGTGAGNSAGSAHSPGAGDQGAAGAAQAGAQPPAAAQPKADDKTPAKTEPKPKAAEPEVDGSF